METFLTYCLICSLIGLPLGAIISGLASTKIGKAVSFLAVSIISIAFLAGMFTLVEYENEKAWNGGICSCGGEYRFINATKDKLITYYFYECDNCGYIFESSYQK